ncbi:MAG: hypothetical protein JW836_10990, partial [Deltaproteobacteria bacterium]|nr:hypothetical protein [Deltaproteobacteria bacterium]
MRCTSKGFGSLELPYRNNHKDAHEAGKRLKLLDLQGQKRHIKTPKLHMGATGLACTLLGLNAEMLWQDRAL